MYDDNLTSAARVRQFDLKQGDDYVRLDHWLVFSNGAMRENNQLGVMIEPPSDYKERAKNILLYHETQLKRAREDFVELKQNLDGAAKNAQRMRFPSPPPSDLEKLKELQSIVKRREKELAAVREKLEEEKPEELRQREETDAYNQSLCQGFLADLSKINI